MIIKFPPAEGAKCVCCKKPWAYNDLVGLFLGSELIVLCNSHALELVKLLIDRFYPVWGKALLDADTAEAEREACAVTCERVKSDGMAGPQFWLDWDILDDAIAAIRARDVEVKDDTAE